MAETKIKAAQFSGVVGNGVNGYVLQSSGDGDMEWVSNITPPAITSLSYPGSATAADTAGGETITITGTGFVTGVTVTVGGTAAPAVSFVSATTLTITTPAKAAGDYDVVVANTDTGSATFINGISYNGIPAWSTSAGSLGTFASAETISTITLAATEPDGGTITFNITNGALPTGLSLTGTNIDGTTSLETAETLYTFTVTATDNESQTTPRVFTITVQKQFIATENFTINTYTGNGSTQSIEGKIGTSASFNGSSSYITTSNPFSGQSGSNQEYSVSLWFKADSFTNVTYPTLFKGFNSSNSAQTPPFVWTDGSIIRFHGYKYGDATVSLNTGQWYHLVVIENGDSIEIWLDGVSKTLGALTTWDQVNADQIKFGADSASLASTAFDGSIDQIRIFDRALLSSEVTTLYGESNTSTTKSTTDIFDDGSAVALYEFEEGAKDTGGVTGYIGAAGIFNGSSGHIDLGTTDFVQNNNSLSISAWCYFEDLSTANSIVTKWNNSGIEESWGFWHYGAGSTTLHFAHRDASNNVTSSYSNTSAISENTWHHCVLVWNGSTVTYYVDGAQVGTSTNSDFNSATKTSSANIIIGAQNEGSASQMTGKIDQVRLFNKGLSSSEVTTLYNETSASSTKSATDIFDDSSGVALYELEGNANDTGGGNGKIGGAAVFNGSSSKVSNVYQIDYGSSISMWVNVDNTVPTGTYYGLWTQGDGSAEYTGVRYKRNSGNNYTIEAFIRLGNNYIYRRNTSSTWNEGWNHFVFIINTTTGFDFYLNGSNGNFSNWFVSGTFSNVDFSNEPAALGIYSASTYYKGKLDEVRYYNKELSASEITTLYTETASSTISISGLQAHYKFEGDATDEQGNYDGTATNVIYGYNGTPTNVTYGYDGTPTNVSFVGTLFQPDFVWIKERNNPVDHLLFDTIRGAGVYQRTNLASNDPSPQLATLSSFDSNGFSVGSDGGVNGNNDTYVAWMWKAGGTAVSNTDGSITSSVSANQDAGFSIVKWTTTAAASWNVGHGLDTAPEMIISKMTSFSNAWEVYHKDVGTGKYLQLASSAAATTDAGGFSSVTDTTWTSYTTNTTGTYIAYCFNSVDGYQKIGSYTGAVGRTVNVGFEPRFIMFKNTSASGQWWIHDAVRGDDKRLFAEVSNAESTSSSLTTSSTGFTLNDANGNLNTSGNTYIYLAIA
jgi:hypothetical protein